MSTNGTSEDTKLANQSVDAIVAAQVGLPVLKLVGGFHRGRISIVCKCNPLLVQAFHWFDVEKSKLEFRRILRSAEESKLKAQVFLIWNNFASDLENGGTEAMKVYEDLLFAYGIDYNRVSHRRITQAKDSKVLPEFFIDMKVGTSHNHQSFDQKGLVGRCLSSSYAPKEGHPNYEPLLKGLNDMFEKYSQPEDGLIKFHYTTSVYYGLI